MIKTSFLLFVFLLSSAAAQTRLGYVNTEKVLSQVEEAKTVLNKIKSLREEYQSGISKLQQELKALNEQLERQKLILTKKKRDELNTTINSKKAEILKYEREKLLSPTGEMFTKAQQLRQPLIDKVLKAIEVVAKDKGIDVVLDNTNSIVLFASGEIDFTEDVITYLNQTRRKTKKKK